MWIKVTHSGSGILPLVLVFLRLEAAATFPADGVVSGIPISPTRGSGILPLILVHSAAEAIATFNRHPFAAVRRYG